jgi:D-glycero-D-manno-heptose 1,7-bisphosphate phosphatase
MIIMKNKAVFLDRDGVINELIYYGDMGIVDSPFTVEQFKLFPDVGKAIKKLKKLGFIIVVVSNQPGIAKNNFSMEVFKKISEKMKRELKKQGATVDAEYYCFHHPYAKAKKYKKNCDCRKPKPGMLLKAAKDYTIDLAKSWMIGDGITDIQAGQTAGCKTILIGRMKCDLCKLIEDKQAKPDYIVPNLYKATLIIENK